MTVAARRGSAPAVDLTNIIPPPPPPPPKPPPPYTPGGAEDVGKDERRAKVMKLLAEVGLEGLEHRRPTELSGGQQQRVAIARAIAPGPVVTLADEPTANVDSATAEMLLALMERLNREHDVTFIFSTHDPRVMARARRVVRLVDGRVESDERKG